MKRMIQLMVPVCVIAAMLVLAAGNVAASDPQKFTDKQMRLAIKDANHGYEALDKVGTKLEKGKEKSATNHFENAIDDFQQALTHFAKAVVGKDQQGAIDDINSGVNALQKALTSLENGKTDKAQTQYNKAIGYFDQAEAVLN